MAKKSRSKTRSRDISEHILDTALRLAQEQGWAHLTMSSVGRAADVSLSELYGHYPSKHALVAEFFARIDTAVLAKKPGAKRIEGMIEESARDRLFEVIMRRLDVLNNHKEAVRAILSSVRCDPVMLCGVRAPFRRSMAWMLECAGLSSGGLVGALSIEGLGVVYLNTLRVWLTDDSTDMEQTMAALDRQLMRVENIMRVCGPWIDRTGKPDTKV